jgi:hypothetical protein
MKLTHPFRHWYIANGLEINLFGQRIIEKTIVVHIILKLLCFHAGTNYYSNSQKSFVEMSI